jgi:hypothetical protein
MLEENIYLALIAHQSFGNRIDLALVSGARYSMDGFGVTHWVEDEQLGDSGRPCSLSALDRYSCSRVMSVPDPSSLASPDSFLNSLAAELGISGGGDMMGRGGRFGGSSARHTDFHF